MNDLQEIENLFNKGVDLFNQKKFYDAHEEWEEMWSNYYLKDRLFIQGLIQVTVSFYHLSTNNIKGAKNLMKRGVEKLNQFLPNNVSSHLNIRGINSSKFILSINACYENLINIDSCNQFDWNLVPKIKK